MDVSIIIVNYHSMELVKDCINSIFEKTKELTYEIIVVDNDSRDGSVEKLKEYFENKIFVIDAKENLGFGKANNIGARVARGKFLFFLNPDTILINNAMKYLLNYLNRDPKVGIVGGNLYGPEMNAAPSFSRYFDDIVSEKKNASWSAIVCGKIKEKLRNKKYMKRSYEENFNYSGIPMEVAYIFGADMMMKRSLFNKVGGFDPDFFMYAEEEELSWRIHQIGKSIVSVPDAKIIHLEGMTVKKIDTFSEKQFRMRMNGGMLYYKKRFGMSGVNKFYKLRLRRYRRLILIAKLRGKNIDNFEPSIQRRLLEQEYHRFLKENGVRYYG